jgi:hypothetical protein
LRIFHDDAAGVYLNGRRVATLPGKVGGYMYVSLDEAASRMPRQGSNTFAVHVHQDRGRQYIDLGPVEAID